MMNTKSVGKLWYRKMVLLGLSVLTGIAVWSIQVILTTGGTLVKNSVSQSQRIDDIGKQLSSIPILNSHLYKIDGEIKDNSYRICKLEHRKDTKYNCDSIYYSVQPEDQP